MHRPLDASLHGRLIDAVFDRTALWCGGLLAIAVLVLVYALIFDRAGRHPPRHDHGTSRLAVRISLGSALLVFLCIDGILLRSSYRELHDVFWRWPTAAEHPLRVEILAQQWSWNVRYAGPDEQFGTADDIVQLNELHVPIDRPVHVALRSKDVVHSFYLPNFRAKQDAIPGATTQTWFQAERAGRYELGCAQHCGAGHYLMRGWLYVESAQDHAAWTNAAARAARRRYDPADTDAHWGWDFGH